MKEKWLAVNLYNEKNKPKISRIIQIEWELTEAVRAGHKSYWGDQFKEKRNEMLQLRKELIESK
jgi:hypothetical protein